MPTLDWIGKDKVVNHHQEVPFRVLEHKYGFWADDETDASMTDCGNKIIHGDNLEALKSLIPEYEGKVYCIYLIHLTTREKKGGLNSYYRLSVHYNNEIHI